MNHYKGANELIELIQLTVIIVNTNFPVPGNWGAQSPLRKDKGRLFCWIHMVRMSLGGGYCRNFSHQEKNRLIKIIQIFFCWIFSSSLLLWNHKNEIFGSKNLQNSFENLCFHIFVNNTKTIFLHFFKTLLFTFCYCEGISKRL